MKIRQENKNNINYDSQLIQNTYVIYTPKIIKFVYKGNSKILNQKAYIHNQMAFSDINHVVRSQIISKNLSESNHSKKSQKIGKIQLVSTKKPFIRLKGKGKQKRSKTEHSQLQNSLKQSFNQHFNLPQHKDHISTVDFVESFGCNFFSECSDNSHIDINQRIQLSFDNSRKTFQKSEKQKSESKIDGLSIKKQDENSQPNGKSFYDFKKRKNIFSQLNLNKTFDLAYKGRDRSRSRKNIFQQRIKLYDLSFSKDRSNSKRKRIFQGLLQQKSRITIKSHEQQLQECQIPKSIYEQWEKFSPQSESKQIGYNRGILQTVQQLRMQQSQVKLID